MSKQTEAKAKQNYQDKPLIKRCRACKNLAIVKETDPRGWNNEKRYCSIGGFRVKANSICDLFEAAQ